MYWTDRPWWTIADAARLLRVAPNTLYNACASGDFPAKKVGPYWRIPCEAMRMRPLPTTRSRTHHITDDAEQLELDLGPIIPIKLYRNGEVKKVWDYEAALWRS